MSESLWNADNPPRFFVVPDDFVPPPGDFAIRSLTGQRRTVDPAGITTYERSQQQATEWLQGQVGNVLEGVRGWLDNVADRLTGADADPLGALREAVDRTQHLAARVTAAASHRQPPEIQTLLTLSARLIKIAEGLNSAAVQSSPPI